MHKRGCARTAADSNGARARAWKYHPRRRADSLALEVTVCHSPPGTSKGNKIEHRMFSAISLNWRGLPLVSYETVVNLIASTKNARGLRITAVLDERAYETGVKISDEEMARLNLKPHHTSPDWNYTIAPRGGSG